MKKRGSYPLIFLPPHPIPADAGQDSSCGPGDGPPDYFFIRLLSRKRIAVGSESDVTIFIDANIFLNPILRSGTDAAGSASFLKRSKTATGLKGSYTNNLYGARRNPALL
jgi:hypothetical protein